MRNLTRHIFYLPFLLLLTLAAYTAEDEEKVILAMGDSLMAGYNLPPGEAFPDQLEIWLKERGQNVRVINAGVSGDTTSGALSRLEWTLSSVDGGNPDLFILEFGGNDFLRGIDPAVTRKNMDSMLATLKDKGVDVLIMGMKSPPNMGPAYEEAFNAIYPDMAEKYDYPLYPFYLEGVAANPELNLPDGIHPNEKGIEIMVEKAGPVVLELLEDEV